MFNDFNDLVASFVLVVFVFSNLFILLGRRIIMNIPTVRRFLKDKDELANAVLAKAIPKGTEIAVMCLRLLRDYLDCSLKIKLQRYARRTIGDVIERCINRIILLYV